MTRISCSCGPNLTALSNRLRRIWRKASASIFACAELSASSRIVSNRSLLSRMCHKLRERPGLALASAGRSELTSEIFETRRILSTRWDRRRDSTVDDFERAPAFLFRSRPLQQQRLGKHADLREAACAIHVKPEIRVCSQFHDSVFAAKQPDSSQHQGDCHAHYGKE